MVFVACYPGREDVEIFMDGLDVAEGEFDAS